MNRLPASTASVPAFVKLAAATNVCPPATVKLPPLVFVANSASARVVPASRKKFDAVPSNTIVAAFVVTLDGIVTRSVPPDIAFQVPPVSVPSK